MGSRFNPNPPPRNRHPVGPIATIGELHRAPGWLWVRCATCGYQTAMTLAPLVIRFGQHVSSDYLREAAVCPVCGGTGATLQLPSWIDRQRECGPLPKSYSSSALFEFEPKS
jgi:hypothetical protein